MSSLMIPDCKRFTGYKPCFPQTICFESCVQQEPVGVKILIINLDAMGAVVQTTAMLPAVKRKYPQSHISWITEKNAFHLLDNNPYLDAVYAWEPESWLVLQNISFDVVYSTDKTKRSTAFAKTLRAKEILGFGLNDDGKIIPLNEEAEYSYRLGLNDTMKFRGNTQFGTQILQESMRLEYKRDEYVLMLSEGEQEFCRRYKQDVGISDTDKVIGFNTGCSYLFPNKKMTIDQHVDIIAKLSSAGAEKLVLLGGREDTERNAEIVNRNGVDVISTPTTEGVRRGICYENICDVVITGDSFGMHVAIGLKKFVIAWFGLSCWSEIDLYDRGVLLVPDGLDCAPCWKKQCPFDLQCIRQIDNDRIATLALRGAGLRR